MTTKVIIKKKVVHARCYEGTTWCGRKTTEKMKTTGQWGTTTCLRCLKKAAEKGRTAARENYEKLNEQATLEKDVKNAIRSILADR